MERCHPSRQMGATSRTCCAQAAQTGTTYELIDALFNVGNTATVQGVEIELLFTEDRGIGRISK